MNRRAVCLGGALMAFGCDGPHYVSLGWNDSAVRADRSTSDAGVEAQLGSEAPPADFTRANARDRSQPCSFGLARVELATACDTRALAACPELGETPERTLDAVLSSVLRECGVFDNLLSVGFEQGCALAFELASDALAAQEAAAASSTASIAALPDAAAPDVAVSQAGSDAGALDSSALDTAAAERAAARRCIGERLATQRFECARDIACGEGVNSAPLTR